jgi:hypothetical protein
MTNPTPSYKSWQEWFDSRDSANHINKSHQEELFKTFNATETEEKVKSEVIQHEETAFLFKVNFGESTVNIFHHMKKMGGTIYQPAAVYGFLQGVGESTTWPMTPDIDTLCTNIDGDPVAMPTTTNLVGLTTLESVENLTLSATIRYKPRNFIPIPPFLLKTIQETITNHNGDAANTLLQSAKAIVNFDNEHANDDEYVDKARNKCKDLLFWLYLVTTGSETITATPVIGCTSPLVSSHFKQLESSLLVSNPSTQTATDMSTAVGETLKRPFEVLATSASSTADFVEKLTQLQSQSNDKATKSFKKIPTKYQNMILVASSTGEATNAVYEQDAKEFFKATNVLNAQVLLNSELETAKLDCSVSPAMATALSHGGFLWSSPLTPSGFAASIIVSEGVLRTDTLYEGMVLDYSTKHDMSTTSLEKLTKTQVMYPSNIEAAVERIQAIQVLASYFFGRRSFISQGLTKLVNSCLDNKQLLRTKYYMDSQFIAKLIYAIDDRIYQWLRQCSIAETVTDTSLELTEFNTIFKDVLLSRFDISLPPNIVKIKQKTRLNNSISDEDMDAKRPKATPAVMIRNPNIKKEWKLRNTEKWETIFRGKSRHGPILSFGGKPCLKYHVKGFCFGDCTFIDSHKSLNNEDEKTTENYIKELRGE